MVDVISTHSFLVCLFVCMYVCVLYLTVFVLIWAKLPDTWMDGLGLGGLPRSTPPLVSGKNGVFITHKWKILCAEVVK